MSEASAESYTGLAAWAVYLGMVLLVGVATFGVVGSVVTDALGGSGVVQYVALVPAALVARWTTIEITTLRLHGSDALQSGNRRQLLGRIVLLSTLIVAVVGRFAWMLLEAAVAGWNPADRGSVIGMTVRVLGAGFLAAAVARGFYHGYRTRGT